MEHAICDPVGQTGRYAINQFEASIKSLVNGEWFEQISVDWLVINRWRRRCGAAGRRQTDSRTEGETDGQQLRRAVSNRIGVENITSERISKISFKSEISFESILTFWRLEVRFPNDYPVSSNTVVCLLWVKQFVGSGTIIFRATLILHHTV